MNRLFFEGFFCPPPQPIRPLFQWFVLLTLFGSITFAQTSPPSEITASGHGITIKKKTSATSICSGQLFTFQIEFSIPVGTTGFTITDNLPQGLLFEDLYIASSLCGGTVSTNTPAQGQNGTVSVTVSNVTIVPCGGSFTISVRFANGTTCPNFSVDNSVTISATVNGEQRQITAGPLKVFATAVNPWRVQVKLLGLNGQEQTCPEPFVTDKAIHRICVWKENPLPCGPDGQLNLVNGVVTFNMPPGAQFISASCPNVTYNSNTQTVTWSIGGLSATQQYNMVCCDIEVDYGNPTPGSYGWATAFLSGSLGTPACNLPFTSTKDSIWYQFIGQQGGNVSIFKWLSSSNKQPGCAGCYKVRLVNTRPDTLYAGQATIVDALPSSLTLHANTISASPSYMNFTVNGNTVTATLNQALPPGECVIITICFGISPSALPNQQIQNCAVLQVPGQQTTESCVTFLVEALSPRPCIAKQICPPQILGPLGTTFRYRIRLQNIGGLPINGATITDVLDPNLEYVGNPQFYSTNTWDVGCSPPPQSVQPWTPQPQISVNQQTVTISGIQVPATCQELYWDGCGAYGNNLVPYYWVEFDVKVRDNAAIGHIPNSVTISGGGIQQQIASNTIYYITYGNYQIQPQLSVAAANTPSNSPAWQTTMNVSANQQIAYKLECIIQPQSSPTVSYVPIRNLTYVDLLPRNSLSNNDVNYTNGCSPRSSQFDVLFASFYNFPISNVFGYRTAQPLLPNANPNGLTPLVSSYINPPLPPWNNNLFGNNLCNQLNAGPWAATIAPNSKNVAVTMVNSVWGTPSSSQPPPITFNANVGPASLGQQACNSFLVGGTYSVNTLSGQQVNTHSSAIPPLISNPVCIRSTCDSVGVMRLDTACCQFRLALFPFAGANVTKITWWLQGGVMESILVPLSNNCSASLQPPNPFQQVSGNINFASPCSANPLLLDMEARSTTATGIVTVFLTIQHANGTVCTTRVELKCARAPIIRCDALTMQPFTFPGLNISWRRFTINNMKIPPSPIQEVHIELDPPLQSPCTRNGGGLEVDGSSRTWSITNSGNPPYSLISMNCQQGGQAPHGNAAQNTVAFNLGIDWGCNWQGNVKLRVVHCDGDTCELVSPTWCAKPPGNCLIIALPFPGVLPPPSGLPALKHKQLQLMLSKKLLDGKGGVLPRYATVVPMTTGWEVVGVNIDDYLNDNERESARYASWANTVQITKNDATKWAFVEILADTTLANAKPAKQDWLLTAILAAPSDMSSKTDVVVTVYDGEARPLISDTVRNLVDINTTDSWEIVTNRGRNQGRIIDIYPNPSSSVAEVHFIIPQAANIIVEVCDLLGQCQVYLRPGWYNSGQHVLAIPTDGLTSGSYILRLRTGYEVLTAPLRVAR